MLFARLNNISFSRCPSVPGLYDFSISVKYPLIMGFGSETFTVVFRFPDDVLPDGIDSTVVKDPRTTLGHAIVGALGYSAREFHTLSPLLHKYCSPLLKCANGDTAADLFTSYMLNRETSDARPSRVMNKRLRDMQNDVEDMTSYINAPPPKKGKPVSFLSCLPEDILRGVMRVMAGGSMDEVVDTLGVV